jgi:hypothetical protein
LRDAQKSGILKRVTDLHNEAVKESVVDVVELTQAMAQEALNRKPPALKFDYGYFLPS